MFSSLCESLIGSYQELIEFSVSYVTFLGFALSCYQYFQPLQSMFPALCCFHCVFMFLFSHVPFLTVMC